MKETIFNFIYDLLLILGIITGIYEIGHESAILECIGAILVFGMPTITFLVEYAITDKYR